MMVQIEIDSLMRMSLVASAAISTKSKASSNPKSASSDSQLDVNLQYSGLNTSRSLWRMISQYIYK